MDIKISKQILKNNPWVGIVYEDNGIIKGFNVEGKSVEEVIEKSRSKIEKMGETIDNIWLKCGGEWIKVNM
uniref:DUF5678 domain-containing protein n=1 Tax=viral metagenome TaxID=1070528 RepID=A0A6M3IK02_9ZZZZ